jgi:hypothetical protein
MRWHLSVELLRVNSLAHVGFDQIQKIVQRFQIQFQAQGTFKKNRFKEHKKRETLNFVAHFRFGW